MAATSLARSVASWLSNGSYNEAQMANITLRSPGATWSEALQHRFDAALDFLEQAARRLLAERRGDFGKAAHAARIRRMAAHGCNGQALM
jgi:hypothetical protein